MLVISLSSLPHFQPQGTVIPEKQKTNMMRTMFFQFNTFREVVGCGVRKRTLHGAWKIPQVKQMEMKV